MLCFACATSLPIRTPRICFSSYPTTMDPRLCADFSSAAVIGLLYEGLTRCLPDGSIEKAVAEKIQVSDDLCIYTFILRKTCWSDGSPVLAEDFARSWRMQLNPSFPSIARHLFYPIQNAEKAAKSLVSLEEVGIRAIDEQTLQVVLERPTPFFLSLTAFPSFFPAKEDGKTLGNGPFRIASGSSQLEIILERNAFYWNQDKISVEKIVIAIIPDEHTALRMFEQKELDWMGGVLSPIPHDAARALLEQGDVQHLPIAASTFCAFNMQLPLFANRHIRLALLYSIDRNEIAEKIIQTGPTASKRCVPQSLWGKRTKELLPPFDPIKARLEFDLGLQELGIKRDDIDSIELDIRTGHIDRQIGEALCLQFKRALGIDLRLVCFDTKLHKERLHHKKYQIALANWIAQYHDPFNILERMQDSDNVKNYPGWQNAFYYALLQQSKNEMDPKKRLNLLEEAEQILCEDAPLAPIYEWSNPVLCSKRLKNVQTTPSGGVLFDRCFLDCL